MDSGEEAARKYCLTWFGQVQSRYVESTITNLLNAGVNGIGYKGRPQRR